MNLKVTADVVMYRNSVHYNYSFEVKGSLRDGNNIPVKLPLGFDENTHSCSFGFADETIKKFIF